MRPAAAGAKGMSPFCFFAVCFLVSLFTAVLVLLLLEQDEQDDGPSVPRRTRLAADEAHGGRGPRQIRPTPAGAKGMSPFCFFAVYFLVFSFTALLVLFLLEQEDDPSVPRRTRLAPDGPWETIVKGGILEDSPSSAEGEHSRQAPGERAVDMMLRVDDVLGSEVAVAERGDLRRRHVAARRLELCRAATHVEATATEQPPLPLRILRCCIKVKINLVLKILFGSLINGIFRSAFQCYSSHLFVSSHHSTDGNFIGIVFYLGWCCGNRSCDIDVVFFLFRRYKGNYECTLDVKHEIK